MKAILVLTTNTADCKVDVLPTGTVRLTFEHELDECDYDMAETDSDGEENVGWEDAQGEYQSDMLWECFDHNFVVED